MRFVFITIVTAAAIVSCADPTRAVEADVPAWHRAAPGTQAFLEDDGGGAETATVCDTADRYRDWLAEKHPLGCRKFKPNLSVTIEEILSDPVKDTNGPNDRTDHTHLVYSIAKILIPSKLFFGYVHLDQLQPAIPPGITLYFKNGGSGIFELHERAKFSNEHGVDLGDHFSAKVIKYDPTNDNNWDINVTILDGEHSGQSGWMLLPRLSADADDGYSIDQFTNAVSTSSVQLPFDCNDFQPRSEAYESGNFDAAFKELQPLALERCAEAEHLLGVMYGQGRGVEKDFVHAYALLLLAYSDGMTPDGGKALVPVLGDVEGEPEIVQFGAQLTNDQLGSAETLAKQLAQKKGKLANPATADPTKVASSIKELHPRVAGYKLNGELATIELPRVATALSQGMIAVAPDHVLTQIVKQSDARILGWAAMPVLLQVAERDLRAVGLGTDYVPKSALDEFAANQGESFAWLNSGTRVRVAKYFSHGGFSQIDLLDDQASQRHWVDNCFLRMQSESAKALWSAADAGYCEAHRF